MRNTEYCDRCLPTVFATAMGYIPLLEMSNAQETRLNEDGRKILLCNYHYFEAKKNCYYVVPFDKENDPIDSFLTRINAKHKLIRGSLRLKFKQFANGNESVPLEEISTKQTAAEKRAKVHLREEEATLCGLPLTSTVSSENEDSVTCRNCTTLKTRRKLEKEFSQSYA